MRPMDTSKAYNGALRPTAHWGMAYIGAYGSHYDPQCTGAGARAHNALRHGTQRGLWIPYDPQCSGASTHNAPGQLPGPTMHQRSPQPLWDLPMMHWGGGRKAAVLQQPWSRSRCIVGCWGCPVGGLRVGGVGVKGSQRGVTGSRWGHRGVRGHGGSGKGGGEGSLTFVGYFPGHLKEDGVFGGPPPVLQAWQGADRHAAGQRHGAWGERGAHMEEGAPKYSPPSPPPPPLGSI